jgi:hypothetical protein
LQFGAQHIGRYNIKHRTITYNSLYLRFLKQLRHIASQFDRPATGLRSQSPDAGHSRQKEIPPSETAGLERKNTETEACARLLLPRALLVAVRFQALSALVLVHLQTTFLFQITHGE